MKLHSHARRSCSRQRGAALVISLMLLLVMTLLGLGASQSTRMQERMAGNQRDIELAMQGAEAGLRVSESRVSQNVPDDKVSPLFDACDTSAAPAPTSECFTFGQLFFVDAARTTPLDLSKQTDDWWRTYAKQYTTDMGGLARAPQYVNEYYKESRETLSDP